MKIKNLLSIFILFISSTFIFSQTTYTYTGKPIFQILAKRTGTTVGIIKVELFPNIAPLHTRNFDSLVSKQFYDTTAFHRVIPGFVIQGGDPNSRHGPTTTWGQGQVGQPTVKAEFSTAQHLRGILSAARVANNINSATSQFFICVAPAPNLNGQYSVYGRVLAGMDIVDTIVNAPRNQVNNMPFQKIEMFVTYIGSNDTVPAKVLLNYPPKDTTNLDTLSNVMLKWKKVSDGIIYHVEVSDDPNFSNILFSSDLSLLQFNITPNLLLPSTTYHWRVRTNNGGHFSPYSDAWKFTTMSPFFDYTGIDKPNLSNKNVKVFPNPSSGKFELEGIAKESVLEIIDINGHIVLKTNVTQSNFKADFSDKPKGIYFYKLTEKNQKSVIGKLVLR